MSREIYVLSQEMQVCRDDVSWGGCYKKEVCWLKPTSHKLPYYFQI